MKNYNTMTRIEKNNLFLEVGLLKYEEIVRKAERDIIKKFGFLPKDQK